MALLKKSVQLTNPQRRCLEAIETGLNGHMSTSDVGDRLWGTRTGKPQHFILPAAALLHRLRRRGLVLCFSSDSSEWAIKLWAVTPKGEKALRKAKD